MDHKSKRLPLAPGKLWLLVAANVLATASLAAPIHFQQHLIEKSIPGGYRVVVTDMNRDGRPDIIGLSGRGAELYWYENPTWERHVITGGMTRMISVAAADIDDDGIPELALATHFGQTDETSEGLVFHLHHQGDPREPWQVTEFDRLPTSHRLIFADLDGDGRKELINAALTGSGARQPMFEGRTPIVFYRPGEWKRELIYDQLDGIVHGLGTVDWDGAGRAAILTAGFDGVFLHRSTGSAAFAGKLEWSHERLTVGDPDPRPKSGSSEIRVGHLAGGRFLATIEPWHGDKVVVYTPSKDSQGRQQWQRHVIDDTFQDGHAVEVADFDGDGTDEVVAGFRGEAASTYLYVAASSQGDQWKRQDLDAGGMAAAACDIADLNADGRLDIVCIGARTANIKWYEGLPDK
jgi:FG-GAP-like repeat